MGQSRKLWIYSTLAVLTVSIYPVVFLYTYNADEVSFYETLIPSLLFLTAGILFYIIGIMFTKSPSKGAIISVLFMLLLSNYALLEKGFKSFLPSLRYWHILPICIFILLHIIYFILKKTPSAIVYNLNKMICIVFCGLILMNFIMALPDIVNKVSQEKFTQQKTSFDYRNQNKPIESKPNIYLFIFDEYASFDVIKKYYQYDNSNFKSFLENRGFTVSNNSHNETIATRVITTNLINFDYVVTNSMTEPEIKAHRQNAKLFSLLRDRGYSIQVVGEASQYGFESPVISNESGTKTIGGKTFKDILLQKTVIYPFAQQSASAYAKRITDSISYVSRKENIPAEGSQFTFMHLLTPHTPFAFDENGNPTPSDHHLDWKEKKYYLGQYIYTTKLMMQLADAIVEYDPDSIIILQSDHGPRGADTDLFLKTFQPEDMRGILNAVYYRGEPIPEIEGQSGVNTIRIVLDKLFALDLGLVEVPEDDFNYK